MITKSQLNRILFIQRYIVDKNSFIKELFRKLEVYSDNKINKDQFNQWLDSWEATAELDQDPEATKRIRIALNEIKSKKTPHKSWKEFKQSMGLP